VLQEKVQTIKLFLSLRNFFRTSGPKHLAHSKNTNWGSRYPNIRHNMKIQILNVWLLAFVIKKNIARSEWTSLCFIPFTPSSLNQNHFPNSSCNTSAW
jgi:hypothetical protein